MTTAARAADGDAGRNPGTAVTTTSDGAALHHPGVHAVVGAGGATGRRLVVHLHAAGYRVRALGHVVPLAREGAEMVYRFEQPFVVDGSRAARACGLAATPYEEGVRRTLAASSAAGG